MNTEAFVYCWTDWRDEKLYIGYHCGSPDDGYICSSKPMLAEYKQRPNDFSRQIVASGSAEDMQNFEQVLLRAEKVETNEHYYNMNVAFPPAPRFGDDNAMRRPEVAAKNAESQRAKHQNRTPEEKSAIISKGWETRRKKYGKSGGNWNPNIEASRRGAATTRDRYGFPASTPEVRAKAWETRRKRYGKNGIGKRPIL
jgi:hypothetical protein